MANLLGLSYKVECKYNEIMGNSDNQLSQKEETGNFEFFSMYDKAVYETRTYSNLNNVKL